MTENYERFLKYREINERKIIPAVKKIGELKTAWNMEQCATIVYARQCPSCDALHYSGHTTCKARFCLNCMRWRALTWVKYLLPIFEDWIAQGNMVTKVNFTVRDGMPLVDPLGRLEHALKTLRAGNGSRKKFEERFVGGVRSLEVKIGANSKMWHPHAHSLIMQPGGVYEKDYDWLSDRWHSIVGHNGCEVVRKDGTPDMDWNGNVWMQKVNGADKMEILKAIVEAVKYILKPEPSVFGAPSKPVDIVKFKEMFQTLKGKRQIATWGLLYNIQSKVDAENETESEEELIEYICRRCGCKGLELVRMLYKEMPESTKLLDLKRQKEKQ